MASLLDLRPRRTALPALLLEWTHPGGPRPLPKKCLRPTRPLPPALLVNTSPRYAANHADGRNGSPEVLDLSDEMTNLFRDIVRHTEELSHIDAARTLVTVTRARSTRMHGLQAKVTPLRFRDGKLVERRRNRLFQVQRYRVNDVEMLYLVTFCLPRFFERPFEQKLVTVFHELFHIAPEFNGDLRRLQGRYSIHTASKRGYDAKMEQLAQAYLRRAGASSPSQFLRWSFDQLFARHAMVRATTLPMPKLVPVS